MAGRESDASGFNEDIQSLTGGDTRVSGEAQADEAEFEGEGAEGVEGLTGGDTR